MADYVPKFGDVVLYANVNTSLEARGVVIEGETPDYIALAYWAEGGHRWALLFPSADDLSLDTSREGQNLRKKFIEDLGGKT